MKNFLLVAALLAASVCYAKVFRTNCSICGVRMVVNTENSDTYGGALTETEFSTIFGSKITQSDYFCKKISCAKKAAAIKRERKKQLAASNQKQVDKNKAIKARRDAVNKMAATDAGLTIGRVSTGRNTNEKLELGFKMIGMMFLNFIAPIWIAKGFDKISNILFNTNVNLDPKILNDKNPNLIIFVEKKK